VWREDQILQPFREKGLLHEESLKEVRTSCRESTRAETSQRWPDISMKVPCSSCSRLISAVCLCLMLCESFDIRIDSRGAVGRTADPSSSGVRCPVAHHRRVSNPRITSMFAVLAVSYSASGSARPLGIRQSSSDFALARGSPALGVLLHDSVGGSGRCDSMRCVVVLLIGARAATLLF